MDNSGKTRNRGADREPYVVSLGKLAELVDAHRSTVRRWLRRAGIRPVAMGQGRKGAIRYRWEDVKQWLDSREYVD